MVGFRASGLILRSQADPVRCSQMIVLLHCGYTARRTGWEAASVTGTGF